MRITLSPRPRDSSSDVVVVGYFDDRKPAAGALDAAPETDLSAAVRGTPAFRGGVNDTPLVIPPSAPRRPTVVVVGLGPRSLVGPDAVRLAALRAASAVRGHRRIALALGQVGQDRPEIVRAVVEGFLLGCFDRPRPGSRPRPAHEALPTSVTVLVEAADARRSDVRDALERARVTTERVTWARTLADTPPGHLTPTLLAEEIRSDAEDAGVTVRVWSQDDLRAHAFGGLLAVGKGSAEDSQVVELSYGDQTSPLGLTGKGVTFDSGGINLKKPLSEISWMKTDMASAVAVAGAVSAVSRLGLEVGVRAILPLVENMPSGTATRPGDVIVHPNGVTTEITDTDCEGRLILADAIAHLCASGVSGVIDVGTLTDAAGYGPSLWAAASTDDALVEEILRAGEAAGDRGWRMPLVDSYVELMRSQVADLINGPTDIPDSSVLAATYLREFAGATPWVHLDIGSTAWLEQPWGGLPVGPTGIPLRALMRLLEARADAGTA